MSLRGVYQKIAEGPFVPFFKELASSIQEDGFGCEILDQGRSSSTLRISSDDRLKDFEVSLSRHCDTTPYCSPTPMIQVDVEGIRPEWFLPNSHESLFFYERDWATGDGFNNGVDIKSGRRISEVIAEHMVVQLARTPVNKVKQPSSVQRADNNLTL